MVEQRKKTPAGMHKLPWRIHRFGEEEYVFWRGVPGDWRCFCRVLRVPDRAYRRWQAIERAPWWKLGCYREKKALLSGLDIKVEPAVIMTIDDPHNWGGHEIMIMPQGVMDGADYYK